MYVRACARVHERECLCVCARACLHACGGREGKIMIIMHSEAGMFGREDGTD